MPCRPTLTRHDESPFTKYMIRLLTLLIGCWLTAPLAAQVLTGRVLNEYGEPVPYANILVQETGAGTTTDDVGAYRLPFDTEGTYRLVISSLGYRANKASVIIGLEPQTLNVTLLTSGADLEEIVVKANARDPAYAIMKKAAAAKKDHLAAARSYRTNVYVKATEKIDRKKKKADPAVTIAASPDEPATPGSPPDAEEAARRELLRNLNMLEMDLVLNYQHPGRYKEERTGVRKYGQTRGLFIPRFAETDFNFYRNMVLLTGVADAPVISPLSNTAVLSYKFKLEGTTIEGGQTVYQITVTPRKEGNSTVSGTVWINGGSWAINRLDVALSKYTLKFFDAFRLEQDYAELGDRWAVSRQAFNYVAKQGKKTTFTGVTTLSYSGYDYEYAFPEGFFGNEIAVTTREAYERDSSYWAGSRTVALTPEEVRMVVLRDSVEAVVNSQTYQDSIQQAYNKVNLLEIAWDGMGFRNNETKRHLWLPSLASLIDFSPVGGWRVGPYSAYDRRYPGGQRLVVSGRPSYGLENGDLQGNLDAWYQYDAFNLGNVRVSGGRSFENINPYDAFLNQLSPSNFILLDALRVRHGVELFNGLFWNVGLGLDHRYPIPDDFNTGSILDVVVDDKDPLLAFEPYEALVVTNSVSYTPGQKYLREPDRKIRLQSRWPTFTLEHRKGINGVLGSDVNYDYLQFRIDQQLLFGALGTANYELRVGMFPNTSDLRFVDLKRFRQSDPIFFSDPRNSFQVLDTSLSTANQHLEFHLIHHFNGALVNNIPLLKKTRIRAVAGGGFLILPEDGYRYQEVFAGIERVFKVGARRRLRVGTYAVLGDANDGNPATAFKVSFDLIDLWKRNWSF